MREKAGKESDIWNGDFFVIGVLSNALPPHTFVCGGDLEMLSAISII